MRSAKFDRHAAPCLHLYIGESTGDMYSLFCRASNNTEESLPLLHHSEKPMMCREANVVLPIVCSSPSMHLPMTLPLNCVHQLGEAVSQSIKFPGILLVSAKTNDNR